MGCGGIGSWLCYFLAHGIRNGVLSVEVVLADGDVVEPRNLLYSNFDALDVGRNKAVVLAERYAFKALPRFIEASEELRGFGLVVVATDDGRSRGLVFDSGVDYIDLRAKGRAYAVFARGARSREEMLVTVDLSRGRESCQHRDRFADRVVDYGNVIAAGIGYQVLLNRLREELVSREFRGFV